MMRHQLLSTATIGLTAITVTLLASVGCDYEAPRSDDFGENPPNSVITGEVVLAVDLAEGDELGPVILLVTDASNPGPPEGTGGPYTLTTIDPSEFSTSTSGLLSAPFAVTDIPDGDWLITGFMDVDRDFSPLFGPFGGATCGDVLGAHINDLTTQEIVPVTVANGTRVDNVAVTLGVLLTTERPAFTLEASESVDASFNDGPDIQLGLDSLFPQTFRVEATELHAAAALPGGPILRYNLEGPFDLAAPAECQTGFLVTIYDKDGDGVADDHPDLPPGSGLYDIWPRIFLTYLGDSQNSDGSWNSDVPEGELYAGLASYSPFDLEQVNFVAGIDQVDNDGDGSVDETGEWYLNAPIIVDGFDAAYVPAALHFQADGTVEQIQDPNSIPAGFWDVTVIMETGQTWTVPNDLALFPDADPEDGYDPVRQSDLLRIKAPVTD